MAWSGRDRTSPGSKPARIRRCRPGSPDAGCCLQSWWDGPDGFSTSNGFAYPLSVNAVRVVHRDAGMSCSGWRTYGTISCRGSLVHPVMPAMAREAPSTGGTRGGRRNRPTPRRPWEIRGAACPGIRANPRALPGCASTLARSSPLVAARHRPG